MKRSSLLLVVALVLVGCSDDDGETVTAGGDTTASTTTAAPTTTEGTSGSTTTPLVEGGEALEPIDVSELASDPGWEPRPDDPAAVEAFNTYVADGPKPYADSPLDLAAVFLGLSDPEEGVRVEAAVQGNDVTILENNIPDDSIAAQLTILAFEPGEGDVLRLVEVTRQISCRPGRGHEDFSAEPCV